MMAAQVKAEFARLVAEGRKPNEAAAAALQAVRSRMMSAVKF